MTVGFNPTAYTEEEGQAVVFVIQILEGQAQTDIIVNFNTDDVSATGKYIIFCKVLDSTTIILLSI